MTTTVTEQKAQETASLPLMRLREAYQRHFSPQAEREQEIRGVAAAARDFISYLPQELCEALSGLEWNGSPSLKENRLHQSAAAHLGSGVWLYFGLTSNGESRELRLLAPCECGDGYHDREVTRWEDLVATAGLLDALDGPPMPCPEDGSCRSR
ncbi:hypothetical protein [Streptomyces sp. G45]|uniref:hypothetical protein n=1 Tax=Streptomyces sp. G45 TaxID=3406627 RepID=UPI003C295EE7